MRACICILALFWAAPALAAPADEPRWTVSLAGGINAFDDDAARPFGSLAIDHIGDALSLGIAASVVDSSQRARTRATLPSTTYQLTLSAGHAFGAVTLDGHATAGRRRFRPMRIGGASLSSDGTTLGAGAALTWDRPLGDTTLLSPFASVDYSRVDTAVAATVAAGSFARKQRETGVTGGIGIGVVRGVGAGARHQLGFTIAGYATSNDAASDTGTGGRALRFLSGAGGGDQWIEGGPTVSLALSRRVRLGLAATRTAGLASGDATTATATLSSRF